MVRGAPPCGPKISCTAPSCHVRSTRADTCNGCMGHNQPMAKKSKADDVPQLITESLSGLLRVPPGQVDMAGMDPAATLGFGGDKEDAAASSEALAPKLGDLQ